VLDLAGVLAAHCACGYVIAPAGFGKTYLIAEAVSRSADRQLVLTHTYAGVNALRRKMRDLRARDGAFRVDTIASWALRPSPLGKKGPLLLGRHDPGLDQDWRS
jgi:DNA helicase-2/ATP-dependent DNA helicase PcrA